MRPAPNVSDAGPRFKTQLSLRLYVYVRVHEERLLLGIEAPTAQVGVKLIPRVGAVVLALVAIHTLALHRRPLVVWWWSCTGLLALDLCYHG